jgi:very-short-patch-repair endonuclease
VRRRELLEIGVTPGQIKQRLRTGALFREFPGIYRVGHRAPSVEATYLAAVWACGEGALLGGRAAAHLLGLIRGGPPPPEVITPTERRIDGIITRCSRQINPKDRMTWHAIPVTSVPRTLVDLAAVLTAFELGRACHEAGIRHRVTPRQVEAVLTRRPNSTGAGKLKAILRGDIRISLSRLETRFLELLRRERLALPRTNRPAGGRRVDCRWAAQRLTVELDGYEFHNSRHAWQQDRRREREAYARGDQFRRYSYVDVFEDPRLMLAELRALLPGGRPA